MKKFFLLAVVALALSGLGCGRPEQLINFQQVKDQNIIEIQRQEEKEVLKYQADLRAQEEKDKQAAIDDCLSKALQQYRETINILLQYRGLNYQAGYSDPAQIVSDLGAACRKEFPNDVLGCTKINADFFDEASSERETDEANCYARY